MTEPAPPTLDYSTRQIPRRLALRVANVVCLSPLALFKAWVTCRVIYGIYHDNPPRDQLLRDLVFLIIVAGATLCDLQMIWIFTRQWLQARSWIWPVPLFISFMCNLLIGTCIGSLTVLEGPGRASLLAPPALCSIVLMVLTCNLREKDGRRVGERPM